MPQPSFSRTVVEGSGDGPGLKSEGHNSKPFAEDFLQDVISLQWGSGLFFVTTVGGGFFDPEAEIPAIFYSKGGKKWKGPAAVSRSDFEVGGEGGTPLGSPNIFTAVGGKIHNGEQGKILVVGGLYGYHPFEIPEVADSHTVLAYSYDGEEWTSIKLPYSYFDDDKFLNVDIDTEIDNLMFLPEEKLFYADAFYFDGIWARDMFSSGDGVEWERVSRQAVSEDDAPDNPPYVCNFINLAISNQNDNGLTGATNPDTGTILKYSNIRAVPGNMGGGIEFDNPVLRNGEAINIPGLTVDGLCFAGGAFLVSGHFDSTHAAVYRSTDDGQTWKKVKSVDTTNASSQQLYCGGA